MRILKSAAYQKQLEKFAGDFKDKAGIEIAYKFLDSIDESVGFIGKMPKACMIVHELKLIEGLESYEFRKWRVRGFPHSIFFRINSEGAIVLESLYAHRMDIAGRFPTEIDMRGN